MVSVERPSEMAHLNGTVYCNGNSVLYLIPLKLMSITRKDFSFFAMYFDLRRLKSIVKSPNGLSITRFR